MTFVITADVESIEDRKCYCEVRFKHFKGGTRRLLVDRSLLLSERKFLERLSEAGAALPTDSKAALAQVRKCLNEPVRSIKSLTTKAGWRGNSFIYPGHTFGPADTPEYQRDENVDPSFGLMAGSPEQWIKGMTGPCKFSDYLILTISTPLSGPLYELVDMHEAAMFMIIPEDARSANSNEKTKSTSGKTLSARAAQSVIGASRPSDLMSFAITERGFEDYCHGRSGTCGFGDEKGRGDGSGGKKVSGHQYAYIIAGGRSTSRSKKAQRDPDLQNRTWILPFICTGEKMLDDLGIIRTEGQQVRMSPIPVPAGNRGGIFNRLEPGGAYTIGQKGSILAQEVERTITANYGVLMPAYLRLIVPQKVWVGKFVRTVVAEFVRQVKADGDPWERRFAVKFGVVLAAARLAVKAKLAPWTEERATIAIQSLYRRSRREFASIPDATDAVCKELRRGIHHGRFPLLRKGEKLHQSSDVEFWGVRRRDAAGEVLLISKNRLCSLIQPAAIALPVLKELAQRAFLLKSSDNKFTQERIKRFCVA